ncbi:MAG: hypothetical protein F6J93_32715 [Oscillatoria sp. SIO1A7]|nr:hypothetical protein [Oscillatoria sp. SIO1A7]
MDISQSPVSCLYFRLIDIAVSNQQESSHAIGTSLAVTSKERDLNCPNFNA